MLRQKKVTFEQYDQFDFKPSLITPIILNCNKLSLIYEYLAAVRHLYVYLLFVLISTCQLFCIYIFLSAS